MGVAVMRKTLRRRPWVGSRTPPPLAPQHAPNHPAHLQGAQRVVPPGVRLCSGSGEEIVRTGCLQTAGETYFGRCEWDRGPSAQRCCFCSRGVHSAAGTGRPHMTSFPKTVKICRVFSNAEEGGAVRHRARGSRITVLRIGGAQHVPPLGLLSKRGRGFMLWSVRKAARPLVQ